jgi:hypothetical protein
MHYYAVSGDSWDAGHKVNCSYGLYLSSIRVLPVSRARHAADIVTDLLDHGAGDTLL